MDPKINLKNSNNLKPPLAGLLLIMLVVITYSNTAKNEFVGWDDDEYVVNNNMVRDTGNTGIKEIFSTVVSLNYHPLTVLSLRLNNNDCNKCPNKISAKPFIKTNIALHLLNTILVLILILKLSKSDLLISFLVAAIFAVHPMHVESVAWVSGRKDLLSGFFFLSGLISYLNFKNESGGKYAWLISSFILFILSCLSKATAVVFPVVLILINFWVYETEEVKPIRKSITAAFSPRNLLTLLPFFAVSVFLGLMASNIQNGNNFLGMLSFIKDPKDVVNVAGPLTVLQRFRVAGYGFIIYLIKFFFPANQSALHPFPSMQELNHGNFASDSWIAIAATIILMILVIRSLRNTKLYAFGLGLYIVTIALVLQFTPVGMAVIAERYTYLPYIGLALIPATLVKKSTKNLKTFLLAVTMCFIVILIVLSMRQIKVWNNSGTLWSQVIERYPGLEFAHTARGKYYYKKSSEEKNTVEKKKLEEMAMTDFNLSIRAGTKTAQVYESSGVIYMTRGDLKNALLFLNKAISLDPEKGRTYYNRAMVFDMLNRKEESIKDYNSALDLSPEMTLEILSNRSVLFLETGRYRDAINDLDRLIALNRNEYMYYYNRAFARLKLNNIDEAIADYQKALQLNPGDQVTRNKLQILMNSHIR